MAASGTLAATVTQYYTITEIAAWCQGAGLPSVGTFFSQMYNSPPLALLPDGNLSFAQIQAWCAAIGLSVGQFFAGITGNPALATLPDATIQQMYGSTTPPSLPVLSGLQLLGGM